MSDGAGLGGQSPDLPSQPGLLPLLPCDHWAGRGVVGSTRVTWVYVKDRKDSSSSLPMLGSGGLQISTKIW